MGVILKPHPFDVKEEIIKADDSNESFELDQETDCEIEEGTKSCLNQDQVRMQSDIYHQI